MGVIATLLPLDRCQQRVQAAVRGQHTLTPCRSWDELLAACANEPVHLAVIDLFADGAASFERVRQLRTRFPRLTLVAYVAATPQRARDLFDAGRAGLDGLLLVDLDDSPQAVRTVVEQAEARGVAALLRHRLAGMDAVARDAILIVVTRAHMRLTSHRLAETLSINKATLLDRLRREHLPAPQKLIGWGRLIVAGQMLDDPKRSADGIARTLDFPSGSAFRNMCQRYVGATPLEIRERGGARYVAAQFLRTIGRPALAEGLDAPHTT
ncbi:MAG: helix-turn-helix domain-containing protein [Gemmatimonadaceae bacterium]|nr:helix-turn-helix domain-containing protein [Gemmatimonadaceae bacterium]